MSNKKGCRITPWCNPHPLPSPSKLDRLSNPGSAPGGRQEVQFCAECRRFSRIFWCAFSLLISVVWLGDQAPPVGLGDLRLGGCLLQLDGCLLQLESDTHRTCPSPVHNSTSFVNPHYCGNSPKN